MEHLNVIIPVGLAVWGLISALIVYIWISVMKRLEIIEKEKTETVRLLIEHPVLTISSHSLLCSEMWKHLGDRMNDLEKSINLTIRNAILEAARNGREGK
jgi:hypothetical protein